MKTFIALIAVCILAGCSGETKNNYIVTPGPVRHDTVNVKCDSTDWGNDDDQDGQHGHRHHRKPHLKEND